MKNFSVAKPAGWLLLLAPMAIACKKNENPCIRSLQLRDADLLHRVDSVVGIRQNLTLRVYRGSLEALQQEEEQLFGEARDCDYGKDLQAYNYWHRGRLKFPGRIVQELQRLERDSVGR
jgi:hypothetical protein